MSPHQRVQASAHPIGPVLCSLPNPQFYFSPRVPIVTRQYITYLLTLITLKLPITLTRALALQESREKSQPFHSRLHPGMVGS